MNIEPKILYGKPVAEEIYSKLPDMKGKELAIITIGEDDASKVYVKNKIDACCKVGMNGCNYQYDIDDEPAIISKLTMRLSEDDNVVGIMIQKPYPEKFNEFHLENSFYAHKDVDGLNSSNMYQTLKGGTPDHYPATPDGIMMLLDYYNIPVEGKNVVIIGRSDIVGKPMAAMMMARNATVTVCHSKTPIIQLMEHTRNADIIITAVGKAKYFDSRYITIPYWDNHGKVHWHSNKYPVVIDVAMCRDENGKLCGDCNFEDLLPHVSGITPVPGGVGLTTVAALIKHCCEYGK